MNTHHNKTILIGSRSFIGKHFLKTNDAYWTDHKTNDPLRFFDLINPSLNSLPINEMKFDYALITAGQTNISFCEKNKELSYQCNVTGPLKLAQELKEHGIVPIFFSSDYVFDGKEGNYTETSPLSPLNEYGRQKAELEAKIPTICGDDFLILRLSKVFGTTPNDRSLFDEMLSLLLKNQKIRAAHDQIFSPIHVDDVINLISFMQTKGLRGIYNIASSEPFSRYDLALKLTSAADKKTEWVEKISLDDLNENFLRPKNTTLSTQKLHSIYPHSLISIDKVISYMTKN